MRWISGAAALVMVACVHAPEHPVAIAEVGGDAHVVVRAEMGHVWWSHSSWSEPHELWTLPSSGVAVRDLKVERSDAGFVVTFHQDGTEWRGTFDPCPSDHAAGALARNP